MNKRESSWRTKITVQKEAGRNSGRGASHSLFFDWLHRKGAAGMPFSLAGWTLSMG